MVYTQLRNNFLKFTHCLCTYIVLIEYNVELFKNWFLVYKILLKKNTLYIIYGLQTVYKLSFKTE